MSKYVTLLGAEQVSNAGHAMRSAADSISHTAGSIDDTSRATRQWMDEWLDRLQNILEEDREARSKMLQPTPAAEESK